MDIGGVYANFVSVKCPLRIRFIYNLYPISYIIISLMKLIIISLTILCTLIYWQTFQVMLLSCHRWSRKRFYIDDPVILSQISSSAIRQGCGTRGLLGSDNHIALINPDLRPYGVRRYMLRGLKLSSHLLGTRPVRRVGLSRVPPPCLTATQRSHLRDIVRDLISRRDCHRDWKWGSWQRRHGLLHH